MPPAVPAYHADTASGTSSAIDTFWLASYPARPTASRVIRDYAWLEKAIGLLVGWDSADRQSEQTPCWGASRKRIP